MKHLGICTALLLLGTLRAVPCAAESTPPQVAKAGVAHIGVILPLSGDIASFGEAIGNGIRLGYEKLPEDVRRKIELHFEDDHSASVNTVSAFKKLMTQVRLDAVITAGSGASNALAPITEQAKIPLIAIASDPAIVKNRSYAVNFWVTPEEEIRVLLPEVVRRGYKQIARITSQHAGALAIRDRFDKENNSRVALTLDDDYPLDMKDFRPFINRLRTEKDTDAVFVMLLPGQSGLFAKQARDFGVKLPLFSVEIFEDRGEVTASEGALVGQWYVNADDPSQEFFKEYAARYPGASFFAAGNGHDSLVLLGAAVERGSDRETINTFVHTVKDLSGALGKFSASGDNRFTLPAVVKVVTEDGFKKIEG